MKLSDFLKDALRNRNQLEKKRFQRWKLFRSSWNGQKWVSVTWGLSEGFTLILWENSEFNGPKHKAMSDAQWIVEGSERDWECEEINKFFAVHPPTADYWEIL